MFTACAKYALRFTLLIMATLGASTMLPIRVADAYSLADCGKSLDCADYRLGRPWFWGTGATSCGPLPSLGPYEAGTFTYGYGHVGFWTESEAAESSHQGFLCSTAAGGGKYMGATVCADEGVAPAGGWQLVLPGNSEHLR